MDDGRKAVATVPRRVDDACDFEDEEDFEDNSDLPGLLGEIADIVGRATALKLAEARGGTRLDIPSARGLHKDHWLVKLFGHEQATALCRAFEISRADENEHRGRLSSSIHHENLPMGPFEPRKLAREKVKQALRDGHGVRAAARIARVSERTVWRVKEKMTKALPRRTEGNS